MGYGASHSRPKLLWPSSYFMIAYMDNEKPAYEVWRNLNRRSMKSHGAWNENTFQPPLCKKWRPWWSTVCCVHDQHDVELDITNM